MYPKINTMRGTLSRQAECHLGLQRPPGHALDIQARTQDFARNLVYDEIDSSQQAFFERLRRYDDEQRFVPASTAENRSACRLNTSHPDAHGRAVGRPCRVTSSRSLRPPTRRTASPEQTASALRHRRPQAPRISTYCGMGVCRACSLGLFPAQESGCYD